MKRLLKIWVPMGVIVAMSGCVVAPYGYHRGYYDGPRVVVRPAYIPPPVVVVRP